MRPTKLASLRKRLLELRARLVQEVKSRGDDIRSDILEEGAVSRYTTHVADHDSDGVDRDVALAATQAGILKAVESAIERMEKGGYGQCRDCGKEIPQKRLDAVPYAMCCLSCAQRREAR